MLRLSVVGFGKMEISGTATSAMPSVGSNEAI